MAGPKSSSPSLLLERLLSMSFLSRHPSGVPFFIETCEHARSFAVGQTANGTGFYKSTTGMELREGTTQAPPPYETVYNAKTMWMVRSSGINGGYINLNHIMSNPHNLRLGFEIFFAWPYSAATLALGMSHFRFGFSIYMPGEVDREGRIDYSPGDAELNLIGQVGDNFVADLSANKMYGSNSWLVWQNAKLIVDLGRLRFVKLFWNEDEYDLRDRVIAEVASPGQAPRLSPYITLHDVAQGAVQFYTFIGGIILTLEEP